MRIGPASGARTIAFGFLMLKRLVRSTHASLIFSRRARVLCEVISDMFPVGSTVLDVGTGDGTIASLWAQRRPDLHVEGIDVFERPHCKIPVRIFDGRTLPFPGASFDAVSFVDVLHHADDAAQLMGEAVRVSRKWVLVKDHFAENRLDRQMLALMDWVGNAPHGVSLPYNYMSRSEWIKLFLTASLRIDAMRTRLPLYPFPFGLAFGRNLHFVARLAVDES
jgi:SAM-dependent methyltransferase